MALSHCAGDGNETSSKAGGGEGDAPSAEEDGMSRKAPGGHASAAECADGMR